LKWIDLSSAIFERFNAFDIRAKQYENKLQAIIVISSVIHGRIVEFAFD
jgi:hypothetical protein